MSSINTGAPLQQHTTAATQNINTGTTGNLGGQNLQAAQAQPARSLGRVVSDVGSQISRLASRVLNAVAPNGVRANQKIRDGLSATQQATSALLSTLSQTGSQAAGNSLHLQRLMQNIQTAAEPVTSHGQKIADVLDTCINTNMAQMSPAAQHSMLQAVLVAQQDPALQGDATLAAIRLAVEKNVLASAAPILQADLSLAIAQAVSGGAQQRQSVDTFNNMINTARSVLAQHGFGTLPQAQQNELARAVVLQAVDEFATQSTESANQTMALLHQLPASELHALSQISQPFAGEDFMGAGQMVNGEVGLRVEKAEAAVINGCGLLQLPQTMFGMPPSDYAALVKDTGQALADLRELGDLFSLKPSSELDSEYALALDYLDNQLPAGSMRLQGLSDAEIGGMIKGFKQLGVSSATPFLTAEAQARRDTQSAAYSAAMGHVFQAIQSGDIDQINQMLWVARETASAAGQSHMALGGKVDGADGILNFQEMLIDQALAQMPDTALQVLAYELSQPDLSAMRDACEHIGMDLRSNAASTTDPHAQLGQQIFDFYSDLKMLELAVAKRVPVPQAAGGNTSSNVAVAANLLSVFGVRQNSSQTEVQVMRGVGNQAIQDDFTANMNAVTTNSKDRPHASHTNVTRAFILDVDRANYTVVNAQGGHTPLFDRTLPADLATTKAVAQLQAVCTTAAQQLEVSRIANQNIIAGFPAIQLPDGTFGQLSGGETSYTFSKDPQGNVLVKCERTVNPDPKTQFVPQPLPGAIEPPKAIHLPNAHCHFSVVLKVDTNGHVSVHEPVSYDYWT